MGTTNTYSHYVPGAELSYPMPIPGHNYTQSYPQTMNKEIITKNISESSSSSNESSCDSYQLDYTQYPPIGKMKINNFPTKSTIILKIILTNCNINKV